MARKVLQVLLLLSFCFLFVNSKPKPIIIDTDMDIDDVQAIMYLVRSPNVIVKAITVCGNGFTDPIFGVPNMLYVLDQIGCPDIPVAYGAGVFNTMLNPSSPSAQDGNAVPRFIRTGVDLYFSKCLNQSFPFDDQPNPLPAEDVIISVLESSEEPVDVLLLGSATNLAKSFIQAPSIKKKIGTLYWSGGNFVPNPPDATGKTWPYATKTKGSSWNFFIDPLAAERLFVSGLPIYMMTSTAQDDLVFNSSILSGYQAKHNIDPFTMRVVSEFASCTGQPEHDINYWDQSAAVWMEQLQQAEFPTICTQWENLTHVVVSLVDGGLFGRTLTTNRSVGASVKTCRHSSLDLFLPRFFPTLGKQAVCPPPSDIGPPVTADDVMIQLSASVEVIKTLQAQAKELKETVLALQKKVQELSGPRPTPPPAHAGEPQGQNVVNINFAEILKK